MEGDNWNGQFTEFEFNVKSCDVEKLKVSNLALIDEKSTFIIKNYIIV